MVQQMTLPPKPQMVLPVSVILHPWQVEWAAYAGSQRTERNTGKVKNRPDYDAKPEALQTDIEANIASCLCELATSLYTNQKWNGAYWSPKHHAAATSLPDVGKNIEVRRTRHLNFGVPVFEQEADDKIQLVQAYITSTDLQDVLNWANKTPDDFEYVTVLLTGTVAADVAWENSWQPKKWKEKRVCPQAFFQSVKTLQQ